MHLLKHGAAEAAAPEVTDVVVYLAGQVDLAHMLKRLFLLLK
jgi:hypothetical protein